MQHKLNSKIKMDGIYTKKSGDFKKFSSKLSIHVCHRTRTTEMQTDKNLNERNLKLQIPKVEFIQNMVEGLRLQFPLSSCFPRLTFRVSF